MKLFFLGFFFITLLSRSASLTNEEFKSMWLMLDEIAEKINISDEYSSSENPQDVPESNEQISSPTPQPTYDPTSSSESPDNVFPQKQCHCAKISTTTPLEDVDSSSATPPTPTLSTKSCQCLKCTQGSTSESSQNTVTENPPVSTTPLIPSSSSPLSLCQKSSLNYIPFPICYLNHYPYSDPSLYIPNFPLIPPPPPPPNSYPPFDPWFGSLHNDEHLPNFTSN